MLKSGLIATVILGIVCVASFSYRIGVNETIARAAYVQSIPIREESKCLAAQDAECMRRHWQTRASFVAESASRALSHTIPTSMNSELEAYLVWAKTQQGVQLPRGTQ